MQDFHLHRGIRVRSEAIGEARSKILLRGLIGDEGKWKIAFSPVERIRPRIVSLLNNPRLSVEEVSLSDDGPETVCACGDEGGASFYAHRELQVNDVPILISFRASIDDLCVDVRDFLCTAFQLWDQVRTDRTGQQMAFLKETFGTAIEKYFTRALESSKDNQQYRIALCRLAAQDPEIICAHYSNKRGIKGRYQTVFASAFVVRAPVPPAQIIDVKIAGALPIESWVSLDSFIGREV